MNPRILPYYSRCFILYFATLCLGIIPLVLGFLAAYSFYRIENIRPGTEMYATLVGLIILFCICLRFVVRYGNHWDRELRKEAEEIFNP
jgi:hypothetical protein